MTDSTPDSNITLDLEETTLYLRRVSADITKEKARTANTLAYILVGGLVASLPLHLVALWLLDDATEQISDLFERWFAVVGPLAGAAVGGYYVAASSAGTSSTTR